MTPFGLHVVRADVLGDAAGFAGSDLGAADVVQQRGLAVVDVAHDRDHRGARQLLALHVLGMRQQFALGVACIGMDSGVAEFFDTSTAVSWSMVWVMVAITPI